MTKSNKLSDIIPPRPQEKRIRDYAKVNEIFQSYLNEHYEYMAKEIYWYKPIDFFSELIMFLDMNFRQELWRKFFYRDIVELYYERELQVLQDVKVKRQRKKYFK